MNTNRPLPKNLVVDSIKFNDNSILTSATNLSDNINVKKRLRVEGTTEYAGDVSFNQNCTIGRNAIVRRNLTVSGSLTATGPIPYVDNQTGWGLSSWTFQTSTYNKNTDSLIAKINSINQRLVGDYATYLYVISVTQLKDYFSVHSAGTFPVYSGAGNYALKVVKPTSNTIFLLRHDTTNQNIFKFQTSAASAGKYLRCADSDGTVEWANISADIPALSGVSTSTGSTSNAAYSVVDTVGGNRGTYFYPNLLASSGYNNAASLGDIALLGGPGSAATGTTTYAFLIGTFNGYQALRLTSDTVVSGNIVRGDVKLTGGGVSQNLSMNSNGINLTVNPGKELKFTLPVNTPAASATQSSFRVWVENANMNNSTIPILFTKSDDTSGSPQIQSISFNPMSAKNAMNPVVEDRDAVILQSSGNGQFLNTRQLHLTCWSNNAEALTIRQSVPSEDTSEPPNTSLSGMIRLSASTTIFTEVTSTKRTPYDYIMIDREGFTAKMTSSKKIQLYGNVQIQNLTGVRLNDPNTLHNITGKLQVGTSTSNVNMDIYGLLRYYYSSLGNTDVTNYVLCSSNSSGQLEWRTGQNAFPSTITKTIEFTNTLQYSLNSGVLTATDSFFLGNDGTSGNIKWIKLPISETGTANQEIKFPNDISLTSKINWKSNNSNVVVQNIQTSTVSSTSQQVLSTNVNAGIDTVFTANNTAVTPAFDYLLTLRKFGAMSRNIIVSGFYPSSTHFAQPNRVDQEAHLKVVTDSYTKVWSANPGDSNVIAVTSPGNLCVPGFYNYRAYNALGYYETPTRGDMLINWDAETFTPAGAIASQHYYGRATWKNFDDIFHRSISWNQYFEGNVFIGSETAYTYLKYGVTQNVAKNVSELRLFGKMFYRQAASDTSSGNSPLNQVLTCVDATTGEIGWANVTGSYPTNATFATVTTSSLTATNQISCGTLTMSGTGNNALLISSGGITSVNVTTATLNTAAITNTGTLTNNGAGTFGTLTAGFSSQESNLFLCKGGATFENFITYSRSPTVNHVLTCTSTTGKVEWKALANTQLPTSPSFTQVDTSHLRVGTNGTHMSYVTSQSSSFVVNSTQSTNNFVFTTNPIIGQEYDFAHNVTPNKIGSFSPPATNNDPSVYYLTIPLAINFRMRFLYAITSSTEISRIYFKLSQITYYFTTTNLGAGNNTTTTLTNNFDDLRGQNCSWVQIDRTVVVGGTTYQGNASTTIYNVIVPFDPIRLPFAPPNQSADYDISVTVSGKYYCEGRQIVIETFQLATTMNYTLSTDSPYNRSVTSGSSETGNPNILNIQKPRRKAIFKVSTSGVVDDTVNTPSAARSSDVRDLPSTGQDGYVLTLGRTFCTSIHTKSHIYCPNGTFFGCGIGGRQGVGGTAATVNAVGSIGNKGSYNSWGSVFNFFWTTTSKIQTWVDTTLVFEQSSSISDYRIKTNFKPMNLVLDRLCSIPMYQFDMIEHQCFQPVLNKVGFVAHEVQNLFPDIPNLITNNKDEVDPVTSEIKLQRYDEKELIMLLLKGLQEAKAEIDSLKQEVHQLRQIIR